MIRRLSLILLASMLSIGLFAAGVELFNNTAQLKIQGYKLAYLGTDSLSVGIQSALPNDVTVAMRYESAIGTPEIKDIELDNFINIFLGDASATGDTPTVPVFSYAVSSNKYGVNGYISFTLKSFVLETPTSYINASYALTNLAQAFLNSNTNETQDASNVRYTISQGSSTIPGPVYAIENASVNLKHSWTVSGSAGSNLFPYVVRGSVAMVVDEDAFTDEKRSTGIYKSLVTVMVGTE